MFDELEINNNMSIDELFDGKTWIHGRTKNNIYFTLFLITISTEQLKYSLEAINNFNLDIPFIVNCIKNISPTNLAYNQMRLRCRTRYFIQNDEDMELYPNSLNIIIDTINKYDDEKIFLHSFKLIDDKLGLGNPPIIDCLKVYNQDIMKKYPTYNNGNIAIPSVDTLWHKPIIADGFLLNETRIIIGFHGKHRSDFDLVLRYCKILKSLLNSNTKTNSSHICKFLRPFFQDINPNDSVKKIMYLLSKIKNINYIILNDIIKILNMQVHTDKLVSYSIFNKVHINNINSSNDLIVCNKNEINEINKDSLLTIIAIGCISTNNYEYSYDKYPYDIYKYFIK